MKNLIAVVLAVTLVSACAQRPAFTPAGNQTFVNNEPYTPQENPNDWISSRLNIDDNWVLAAATDVPSIILVNKKVIRTKNGNRIIFDRTERKYPQKGSLSDRSQIEVDCKSSQSRLLSVTRFTLNNLNGDILSSATVQANEPFQYQAPNTVGEAELETACKLK